MRPGFEKRFKNGDIVYWCHSDGCGRYSVKYGMVDEQFSDAVVIDYLVPYERRLINGIPILDYQNQEKYKKLPKGWTYGTPLYELTYASLPDELATATINIRNPEEVKAFYRKGWLVKDENVYHGTIEVDITKDGYRVIKKYPMWNHHIDHISIRPDRVYSSYEEALDEVVRCKEEFERQLKLTDEEWSIEQIDDTLRRWQKISDATDKEVTEYREWLLKLSDITAVETRLSDGQIQWKYEDKKRWNYIEL